MPVAVGAAVLALVLTQLGGERFAEAAIRAAEASPRLLVDGWEVTRVDEWSGGEGEMTFTRDGQTLELRWPPAPKKEMERVGEGVYRYRGGGQRLRRLRRWRERARHRGRRRGVRRSGRARPPRERREWLEALPESAVAPRAQAATVDEMLRGVPLPPGFGARGRSDHPRPLPARCEGRGSGGLRVDRARRRGGAEGAGKREDLADPARDERRGRLPRGPVAVRRRVPEGRRRRRPANRGSPCKTATGTRSDADRAAGCVTLYGPWRVPTTTATLPV